MAFTIAKPDKYAKCICCGSEECLDEYKFSNDIKICIVLCCKCVANMYINCVCHKED